MMKWFAHRGASDRFPENTLEAIEAAIPYVDGIEFDVHFSRDGVGVIIHDETVNRTTDGTFDTGSSSRGNDVRPQNYIMRL